MTTQIKRRRGTTTQHSSFTGAEGELTIDTTKDTVVVHDGTTSGGHPLAKESAITGKVNTAGDTMTGDLTVPNVIVSGNVDGRDVSADGTKLDGIEASADVTDATNVAAAGAAMETGADFTGDVTFGDDDKALFGGASDLMIFHQSSNGNSIIKEQGPGALSIQTNGYEINFYDALNNQYLAQMTTGGSIQLMHNGSSKFSTTATGVNITGTAVTDGLTVAGNVSVDGGTIKLDGNYPVGTGNVALGDNALSSGSLSGGYNTAVGQTAGYSNTTGNNVVFVGSATGYNNTTGNENVAIGGASFYSNSTGASNVAVGHGTLFSNTTASNNTAVGYHAGYSNTTGQYNTFVGQVAGVSNTTGQYNTLIGRGAGGSISTGSKNVVLGGYDGNQGGLDIRTSSNNIVLSDGDGNPRMRIDSSGNVGIGTSSPSAALHISSPSNARAIKLQNSASNSASQLTFLSDDGTEDAYIRNQSSSSGQDILSLGTGGSERMRIDSSGNLLVGTTIGTGLATGSGTNNGTNIVSGGGIHIQRNNDANIFLSKASGATNTSYIDFYSAGSTVGSISTIAGRLLVESGDTGLYFVNDTDSIVPSGSAAPRDNAINLGDQYTRFKDLYLSGGVYLGGTGAANKLDDYEEGTWTPVDGSTANLTFTSNSGVYTKIGRLVICSYRLFYPTTSNTANALVNGLPFTNGAGHPTGYNGYNSCSVPINHRITGQKFFISNASDGASINNSTLSGKEIQGTFIYHAA